VLIGLTGRKEVGKDTTYDRIRHLYQHVITVERVGFADLIYRSAAEALGVSVKELHLWKSDPTIKIRVVKELDVWTGGERTEEVLHEILVRAFLQRYGFEAHRNIFGQDFWEQRITGTLQSHQESLLVVTDIRLPTEAEMVREFGGAVVWIHGRDEDQWDLHATEQSLPANMIDFHIDNSARDDEFASLDEQIQFFMGKFNPDLERKVV